MALAKAPCSAFLFERNSVEHKPKKPDARTLRVGYCKEGRRVAGG